MLAWQAELHSRHHTQWCPQSQLLAWQAELVALGPAQSDPHVRRAHQQAPAHGLSFSCTHVDADGAGEVSSGWAPLLDVAVASASGGWVTQDIVFSIWGRSARSWLASGGAAVFMLICYTPSVLMLCGHAHAMDCAHVR